MIAPDLNERVGRGEGEADYVGWRGAPISSTMCRARRAASVGRLIGGWRQIGLPPDVAASNAATT